MSLHFRGRPGSPPELLGVIVRQLRALFYITTHDESEEFVEKEKVEETVQEKEINKETASKLSDLPSESERLIEERDMNEGDPQKLLEFQMQKLQAIDEHKANLESKGVKVLLFFNTGDGRARIVYKPFGEFEQDE